MFKNIISISFAYVILSSFTQACTRIALSEEEIRMASDLIAIAKVTDLTQIERPIEDFGDYPDSFYDFEIEKIFKGNEGIKNFTIAQDFYSSCSYYYKTGSTYLLYLNKNKENPNRYYNNEPATEIIPTNYTVTPTFNPLREKPWYKIYKATTKQIKRIWWRIEGRVMNQKYYLQDKYNYYKYKYGWY